MGVAVCSSGYRWTVRRTDGSRGGSQGAVVIAHLANVVLPCCAAYILGGLIVQKLERSRLCTMATFIQDQRRLALTRPPATHPLGLLTW